MDSFLRGKRVAVVGMARSGIGASKLVSRLGGHALISDLKPAAELRNALTELSGSGVEIETGAHDRIAQEEFDLIVLSPGVVPSSTLLDSWTQRGIPVWSELELASRACDAPWIGVTGSNGKTTTVHLLRDILRAGGQHAILAGNVGDAWSNHLPANAKDVFVVEVSSFQLEYAPTVKPKIAVLLNLFENHLDRHGTMEVYAELKSRLFRNQSPDDCAVINGESEWVAKLSGEFKGKVIRFGTKPEFDFWTDGDSLYCRNKNDAEMILQRRDFPLIGRHNVLNALAAAAAACEIGIPIATVGEALKRTSPVEHRIEFVTKNHGVSFVNDSKSTNMVATQTALDAFESDVILLFGGRPKKESFAALTRRFSHPLKSLVVFGEAVPKVKAELPGGFPVRYTSTLAEALGEACGMAKPGDTVLLSPGCTSFDQFKDYEERGRAFKSLVAALP